ncbi:MAG TPA: ABC transporter permease [Bryobacteraceae bacterium]
MMRYFARRVLHSAVVLFLISVASFVLLEIAPGTYVDEIRLNPQLSTDTVALLKSRYGLDQSLPVRYLRWLRSAARGEFGFSFSYGMPVGRVILPRARNTLVLTLAATVCAWSAALLLGITTTVYTGTWVESAIRAPIAFLQSVPEVLIALLFLMATVRMHWMTGNGTLGGSAIFSATRLMLPALALTLVLLPVLARHAQASITEALTAAHVQAARALGIAPRRFWALYVLRSAANPLISLFGLSIGNLLSASLLVEIVMSWPGVGPLLLEAIFSRDVYIVIDATLLAASFLIAGNLIADALLWLADPRVRLER